MARYAISQPVTQVEAPRLLTGRGRYAGDVDLAHHAHAVFLRSPHAHAQIVSIDDAANTGEGIILVRHLLDPSMANHVAQKSSDGQVMFILTDVDPEAGSYTLDYNREVVGRTLIFTVTMVHIGRLF